MTSGTDILTIDHSLLARKSYASVIMTSGHNVSIILLGGNQQWRYIMSYFHENMT